MSYVSQHKTTDPKGVLLAVSVNAVILGALIFSPIVVAPPKPPRPPIETFDVQTIKPPPPDKPVVETDPIAPTVMPPIFVPTPPVPLPKNHNDVTTTNEDTRLPPLVDGIGTGVGTGTKIEPIIEPPIIKDPVIPIVPIFVAAKRDPKFADRFQPEYPQIMIAREIEGKVRIKILIGSNGRVRQAIIVQATHAAVGDATVKQALSAWRFIPATRDGTAVEEWQTLTVRFDFGS